MITTVIAGLNVGLRPVDHHVHLAKRGLERDSDCAIEELRDESAVCILVFSRIENEGGQLS